MQVSGQLKFPAMDTADGAEGRELAKRFGAQFVETSAKNRLNVDECFHTLVRTIRRYQKVSPRPPLVRLHLAHVAGLGASSCQRTPRADRNGRCRSPAERKARPGGQGVLRGMCGTLARPLAFGVLLSGIEPLTFMTVDGLREDARDNLCIETKEGSLSFVACGHCATQSRVYTS